MGNFQCQAFIVGKWLYVLAVGAGEVIWIFFSATYHFYGELL